MTTHFIVHEPGDSVGVIVVEGVKRETSLTAGSWMVIQIFRSQLLMIFRSAIRLPLRISMLVIPLLNTVPISAELLSPSSVANICMFTM